MITYDMNCSDCKFNYETTWGDMGVITDGSCDNQLVNICDKYSEEVTPELKEKCYKNLDWEQRNEEC